MPHPGPPVPAVAHEGAPPGAAAPPPQAPPGAAPPGAAAAAAPPPPPPESIDYINLYNSPKYSCIWFVLAYDLLDSMLLCVCSVIDHRGRKNVVRASVTHSAIASCATFLFLPHFDVISDLLLNRRTATWNLFLKLQMEWCISVWIHETVHQSKRIFLCSEKHMATYCTSRKQKKRQAQALLG